jgi:outer membrane protein assembly factor BamB
MTDDELVALVQSKSPEELTADETRELRQHLAESETLRTALFETLQMESYLAAALGPIDVKSDQIIARASQYQDSQSKAWTWIAAGLGCVVFLILSAGVFRAALNMGTQPLAEKPAVNPDAPPVVPEPEKGTKEPDAPPRATTDTTGEKPTENSTDPKPPDAPATETPKTPNPWDDILALPVEKLPAFGDVCFDDFSYKTVLPRRDTINKWFEAVAGRNYRITDADTKKGKCGKFEGFMRLRAPLVADGGIRFALEDYNRLAIHAWHGAEGVQLVYYEDQRQRWAAYRVTRKPGESKAETIEFTATDDDRSRRAEMRYGGPLELRYLEGELLLVRGDIVLVRAPLPGLPDDIYFEGKAIFEGLSLVRTKDLPLQREPELAGTKLRPADLAWIEKLSTNSKFDKLPDGGVRLSSKEPAEPSSVSFPLPGVGYREVIFEIANATPGIGVCLNHADLPATLIARVMRNTRSQRINVLLRPPEDLAELDWPALMERPESAVVGSKVWIKLLAGNGCLKWWTSSDGLHWAIGDPIPEEYRGNVVSLGLITCRTKTEAAGTLQSLTIRELPTINALAPRELLERAPALAGQATLEGWVAAAAEACPAGVDLSAWRRACAVRSLGVGLPRPLAEAILESLLDDPATRALPPQQQIAVLHEVMQIDPDPRDAVGWRKGYLTRLHQAGKLVAAEGGLPFSSVRKVLMETPVWSQMPLPVAAQGEAEEELVRLLQQGRIDETLALCHLLKLYHFHENRPMFTWAEAAARRDTNRVTGEAARLKETWKQPLVEELNKEVYNFAADLHSIVDSGALDDASRMIASLEADRGGGLTPSGSDRNLFVSLSGAVKLALAQQPALRAQLTHKLAPLAALRVRQAVAGGDEATIALSATQFEGTEAAAEAYRWLGDRALQNGWFTRALAEYRRAESSAAPSLVRELQPRARLAAAMMGSDYGSAVTEPVSFGGVRMAPSEFEALVTEMKARGVGPLQGTAASASGNLPGPMQVVATNRARFDGPVGQNPNDDGAPRLSQWQIDYAGRQLATVVDGESIYVSNRFQIAAYNATNGMRLWQSQTPAGEMRRGQEWPLISMKPLLTGNAIYARLLYGKSPTLACFEKGTGKLLWQRDGTDNDLWVSDPLFVQGQLLALNLSRDGNREAQLRLAALDPFTGDILVQRRLIALRESWQTRKMCEVTPLDDGLIATLGGITLCCDAAGSVRWVRKHLLLPHDERPEWVFQFFDRPLIAEGRLLAVQPGVETLDCLEVATGRQLWSFAGDRPWRILGRSGGQVIVETDGGIVALNLADGQVAWRHEERKQSLVAAAASDKYVLYFARRGTPDKPRTPALVWLDAASGSYLGSVEFPQWTGNDPRIGPLVVAKDKLWTFFSQEKDPNKDVVELVAGPPLTRVDLASISPWQRNLPPTLVQTVDEVAPAWQLLSGYARANVEKKTAWQSEMDAVVILARPDLPAVLVTEKTCAAGKQPKLNLRVGHEGAAPGQFTVRVDGESVFTQEWKPDTANRWDSVIIDLSKFAGKKVLVTMSYRPTAPDHALWLKSAQIVE